MSIGAIRLVVSVCLYIAIICAVIWVVKRVINCIRGKK